jgi:hypothetical protein
MELALKCWDGDAVCWDQWNDRQRHPHSESADATLNESPDFLVFVDGLTYPPLSQPRILEFFRAGQLRENSRCNWSRLPGARQRDIGWGEPPRATSAWREAARMKWFVISTHSVAFDDLWIDRATDRK